ncbi:MAG: DNA repair protein RadA, partial [Clostridia bacterium]|nr:DNA repair protein RadA [Clostridia bacterium]
GLSGEIRSVSQVLSRIKEAQRLGFKKCIIPKLCLKNLPNDLSIEVIGVRTLKDAISLIS